MKRVLLFLSAFLLVPCASPALELGQVRLNGFISQGYLDSSDNNFLSDSKDGTTQFNEVGLAANVSVSERLRLGLQLLSRDLGDVGNNETRIDWAYGDYSFHDALGVRLGKVKLPMGLYNEGRDSDFMRPMVFLPQSIYDEGNRDVYVSYQGGGLYGNLPLGGAGDFDYHLFYGDISFPDDSSTKQAFLLLANGAVKKVNDAMGTTIFPPVASAEITTDYVYGGSLIYNAPIEGLRLGVSLLEGKAKIDYTHSDGFAGLGGGEVEERYVLSLEYAPSFLTLAAEYSEYSFPVEIFKGTPFATTAQDWTSQAWYVLLSVPLTEQLSASVLYDVYYDNKDDHDGDNAAPFNFLGFRKDLGFGLRYDVSMNWTLKAEYHVIEGVLSSAPVFNGGLAGIRAMKEDWNYVALKASFNF